MKKSIMTKRIKYAAISKLLKYVYWKSLFIGQNR